jgi:hypothetical protein
MQYLNTDAADLVPRVEIGQHTVIFNILHLLLLLHIHDRTTRSIFFLLTQEIKRNIIFTQIYLP